MVKKRIVTHPEDTHRSILRLADAIIKDYAVATHDAVPALFGSVLEDFGAGNEFTHEWIGRLRHPERLEHLRTELYTIIDHADPFEDVFGRLYMATASRSKQSGLGQFFTPQAVSDMMADMSIGQMDMGQYTRERPMRVMEPTCGAGVMLLSMAKTILRHHGREGLRRTAFIGNDLDPLCTCMTAGQLLLHVTRHDAQVAALLVCNGNGLAEPDTWRRWLYATATPNAAEASAAPPARSEPVIALLPHTAATVEPPPAPSRLAASLGRERQMGLFP